MYCVQMARSGIRLYQNQTHFTPLTLTCVDLCISRVTGLSQLFLVFQRTTLFHHHVCSIVLRRTQTTEASVHQQLTVCWMVYLTSQNVEVQS